MADRIEHIDPSSRLLPHLAALATPSSRAAAAAALAELFRVEALLIFVRDSEVDLLLPATGFPQTLPRGRAWHAFLKQCVARGEHRETLPLRRGDERLPSIGYADSPDAALVLVGVGNALPDVTLLRHLLPGLAAVYRNEREAALQAVQLRQARDDAARTATIAKTLDRARQELEQANAQLRTQAEALELQALEMETQADTLQANNIALADARRVAEEANRAKSEFLATMSHELRTPLNAIAGYVQLIDMGVHGPVTEAQRTALGRIARSQRHLLGLINDILNLSRIEAGRLEYHVTDVSVDAVLADISPMIEPQVEAKSLSFEVRTGNGRTLVRADRDKLEQILLNLLSNAIKFTPTGGQVVVETLEQERTPGHVYVRVSDTGVGIPADKLDAIFQPFTQVDASHRRAGGGIGLGLSISRQLARGMGGDLRVRSELGHGSAFTLTLPRASAASV